MRKTKQESTNNVNSNISPISNVCVCVREQCRPCNQTSSVHPVENNEGKHGLPSNSHTNWGPKSTSLKVKAPLEKPWSATSNQLCQGLYLIYCTAYTHHGFPIGSIGCVLMSLCSSFTTWMTIPNADEKQSHLP